MPFHGKKQTICLNYEMYKRLRMGCTSEEPNPLPLRWCLLLCVAVRFGQKKSLYIATYKLEGIAIFFTGPRFIFKKKLGEIKKKIRFLNILIFRSLSLEN